jgi:hypothetical protein
MPELDIPRVQDVGLNSAGDPAILEWAAGEGRIVLTHDTSTMAGYAYERVREGQPMAGVIEVKRSIPIGAAIEGLILLILGSFEDEWDNQIRYVLIS